MNPHQAVAGMIRKNPENVFLCREIVHACVLSRLVVSSSVTPWPVARQAPLSVGFSRQEYRSGLPCAAAKTLAQPFTSISLQNKSLNLQEEEHENCHVKARVKTHCS